MIRRAKIPWLPWLIAITAVVLLALIIFRKIPIPGQDELRKHLVKQNDSLQIEVEKSMARQQVYKTENDSLRAIIERNNGQIKTSTIYHEKIINHYHNAAVPELERFFTDRYDSKP